MISEEHPCDDCRYGSDAAENYLKNLKSSGIGWNDVAFIAFFVLLQIVASLCFQSSGIISLITKSIVLRCGAAGGICIRTGFSGPPFSNNETSACFNDRGSVKSGCLSERRLRFR